MPGITQNLVHWQYIGVSIWGNVIQIPVFLLVRPGAKASG